ncbi:MAG: helix-turn-helix domain-containing protein [Myxococcota bacterium]
MLDSGRIKPVDALCKEFGISRKTAYKWRKRYLDDGVAGLDERSRRPERTRMTTDPDMVVEVVRIRREKPRYGPKKLTWTSSRGRRSDSHGAGIGETSRHRKCPRGREIRALRVGTKPRAHGAPPSPPTGKLEEQIRRARRCQSSEPGSAPGVGAESAGAPAGVRPIGKS